MEDKIVYPSVNDFLRNQLPKHSGLLYELEEYAKEPYIPIIQPEVAQFLKVFFGYSRPKKILEIGTAIGYSALFFAGLDENTEIVTIERNPDMAKLAKDNFKKSGLENRITLIEGDAAQVLETLEGEFDTVFLDAAKGQYMKFLPNILRLLKIGGTLITDNILYRGIVADENPPKKHITIARNLRGYIIEITHNERLETSVIPLGDGVGISKKLK